MTTGDQHIHGTLTTAGTAVSIAVGADVGREIAAAAADFVALSALLTTAVDTVAGDTTAGFTVAVTPVDRRRRVEGRETT